MKKIIFLIIFIGTLNFKAQNNDLNYSQKLSELLEDEFFKTTQIAVSVYDLEEDKLIFNKNEKLLLRPASNMKVLTTAAALLFLEPDYEFKTKIFIKGEIIDSVLTGNIYVLGGFDPDFTSSDLDSLILMLKDEGIRTIKGDLIGDVSFADSLFWGSGWMWDDDPSTDAPYMTSLNINDNAVKVYYAPSMVGSPVNIEVFPNTSFYKIINNSITIDADTSDITITRDWINRSNEIVVKGTLSKDEEKDSLRINLFKPEQYFLQLFKESLVEHGINHEGMIKFDIVPPDASELLNISRTYEEVIINLNKESDNLSAEMTLRAMALNNNLFPASAKSGLKYIDSLVTLIGLNKKDYVLQDGSGVSHYNLVTSELLLNTLIYFYKEENALFKILYNSFPIGGIDGTLKYRMKEPSVYNNVHAKTGTLSGVSSLSGYLNTKSGKMIAFSILMQNFVGSSSQARNYQDKICQILTEYEK